jgi:hypothetical protein
MLTRRLFVLQIAKIDPPRLVRIDARTTVKGGGPHAQARLRPDEGRAVLTSAFRCGRHGSRSIPDLAFVCARCAVCELQLVNQRNAVQCTAGPFFHYHNNLVSSTNGNLLAQSATGVVTLARCAARRAGVHTTRHWKMALSPPPRDSTRLPSGEKRTHMTFDEWPLAANRSFFCAARR